MLLLLCCRDALEERQLVSNLTSGIGIAMLSTLKAKDFYN